MPRFLFFMLMGLLWMQISTAQSCGDFRYQQRVFDVDTTENIVYGTAPALVLPFVAENVTYPYDLTMDVFEPEGDTASRRPLVIFAFPGGFVVGSKDDDDMQSVCDSLAALGYVAATINYRLGVNVASNNSGERAVWRGAQDYSAAIRYFKEFADSFRIDTNYIFAGGASAGSFSLLHCQYATDAQRPPSTYSSPFPIAPDLGCKNCSGNNYRHTSSVRAAINCWGAIGDTSWIDAQDSVPLLSFHGDLDPIVPYNNGFPFTALITLPQVYGSNPIDRRMRNLGLRHEFVKFPGEGHNLWGTVVLTQWAPGSPTVHWNPILGKIRSWIYGFVAPLAPLPFGPSHVGLGDVRTYTVSPNTGSRYCWEVTGGAVLPPVDAPTVQISWAQAGMQTIRVRETNHLGATSGWDSIFVFVGPTAVGQEVATPQGFTIGPNPVGAGKTVTLRYAGWELPQPPLA